MNAGSGSLDGILAHAVTALRGASPTQSPSTAALESARRAIHDALRAGPRRKTAVYRRAGLAGLAAVVAVAAGLLALRPGGNTAFAEVLTAMRSVQTLHVRFTRAGRDGEAWLKRPNAMRIEYPDGTYEVHRGPVMWTVDEGANAATRSTSHYYVAAQRRGLDVVDMVAELPLDDDLSGFFSQEPVEQVRRDDRTVDVYRMEFESRGTTVSFVAEADADTHRLRSMDYVRRKPGGQEEHVFALTVLEYDVPIPDTRFEFEPPEGMAVTVEEPEQDAPAAAAPQPEGAAGSMLSGRITWAESGKPVPGARVTVGREIRHSGEERFSARSETDRDGRWEVRSVPAGDISMSVRSWEYNWPAVPSFDANAGSAMSPVLSVDGRSDYARLDFTVHKPEDYFAHLRVEIVDEDGRPVEGVSARLWTSRGSHQQTLVRGPLGRETAGPDGVVEVSNAWPVADPVRLMVYAPADNVAYVSGTTGEPFTIEPKGSYARRMVLPFARTINLTVAGPDGQPASGLDVTVLHPMPDGPVRWIFPPKPGTPDSTVLTDAQGRATITGLTPGQKVVVILKRPGERPQSATASACVCLRVPAEREPSTLEVMFDERPTRIEGSAPPEALRVFCFPADAGPKVALELPASDLVRDDGRFAINGAPACTLGFGFFDESVPDTFTIAAYDGTLRTEPGHTYVVKIEEGRVELIEAKPLPTAQQPGEGP